MNIYKELQILNLNKNMCAFLFSFKTYIVLFALPNLFNCFLIKNWYA